MNASFFPLRGRWSRGSFSLAVCSALVAIGLAYPACAVVDSNHNGMDDIWEIIYGASGLPPNGDADGDGWTNAQEAAAGTNPFDPLSHPDLKPASFSSTQFQLVYPRIAGKHYVIESKTSLSLSQWTPEFTEVAPNSSSTAYLFSIPSGNKFWRVTVTDVDTDSDGLTDAEEMWLGFDPKTNHTDRNDTADLQRVTTGLAAANTVTLGVLGASLSQGWPSPGVFVVRRSGGLLPITVTVAFTGSATRNLNYLTNISGNTVFIPAGIREVPITVQATSNVDANATESIVATLQTGTGYALGTPITGTITLNNQTATSGPSMQAAARFLFQAAFGPDQALPGDSMPQNVPAVMSMGYSGWIDDQFTRPIGYVQPWVDWAAVNASGLSIYGNYKEFSWWNRVMGAPLLRPDATTTVTPDPLRQRVAFALSEIMVASDQPETLAVEQQGVANFYDLFETYAFGNFRDLLQAVARHPVMGIFLSHLGNQKANAATNVFPDENFAREVMQLFSIGLWMLNPDGTKQLDVNNQPIPTYTNADITELARVFTGLSFGNNANFQNNPQDFTIPMKGFDAYHDCAAKTLIGGLQLPARTPSAGNLGTATMADVTAALDNLFNHQNTGPFIAFRLIQRLVTSNPSPAYISRVSAAFANDGTGVRGNMKAVIKAILLDPEARDPSMITQPTWGRLHEPLLRCVNYAHALHASSPSGDYQVNQFAFDFAQDPMSSPTVFNFFLPAYSPEGPITALGLTAPEFQIVNASTAVSGANYFWDQTLGDMNYYGQANPYYAVKPNLNDELAFLVPAAHVNDTQPAANLALDPDPLLRRLNISMTGGTLSPKELQIIREAVLRIPTSTYLWHRERLRMAIYLITASPEFNVLQ